MISNDQQFFNSINQFNLIFDQFQDIIIFHKNLVAQLIVNCNAPSEKDPETKLIKNNQMLNLYFQQIQINELNQSNVPEKGTVLEQNDFEIDQALLPIQDNEIINNSNDSFLESSGASIKPIQQQSIIQINNIIENSEKQFIHLPYATTFEILNQMIKTNKLWKKFLLIEKFDNLINKILLINRDQNQLRYIRYHFC